MSPGSRSARVASWWVLAACLGCHHEGHPGSESAPSASSALGIDLEATEDLRQPAVPEDPEERARLEDLWTRARDGDGDRARLADRVGLRGVLARLGTAGARGAGAEDRETALRTLPFTGGFAALPWLATAAREAPSPSGDPEATLALEGAVDLSALPRTAADPEDAAELHAGCETLLALARDAEAARARRVLALRALRMLRERGCAVNADIPSDLDAR